MLITIVQAEGKQSDRTLQDELNKLRSEQQSKKNLRDDRQKQLVRQSILRYLQPLTLHSRAERDQEPEKSCRRRNGIVQYHRI